MKLTIKPSQVEIALKAVFPRMPTKKAVLTITAIDGNLILGSASNRGAVETVIERPGQLQVPAQTFRKVLDTFAGVPELQIEGSANGLKINTFKMPVTAWNENPTRPPGF